MKLTACFQKSQDGWWVAFIPEMHGVMTQGKSQKEALENLKDALKEMMLANIERFNKDYKDEEFVKEDLII